ncbi:MULTISPECIES: ATP-grasp domain-containing protein [unclassified Streptomyces]|uniref:ATP-grasp domain-containing protein n=1 Tax=unclassified Streptomyces TaxID=2593676 RepID=UPI0009403457|nr:ATP-grasp domain-containing protein [Streptomyces sp. TSRI0281]OKI43938.1 carboxylase [Streptomyces sp. TSRI0281]
MSDIRTVLLVGGTDAHLRCVKEQEVRVVFLQHPDKMSTYQTATADVLVMIDYTDYDQVLPFAETARTLYGVDAVLSLTEGGLTAAARLNDHFGFGDGLRGEVSTRMRDKLLMRRHLDAQGHPNVPSAPVTDRASLEAFGERAGYPFILKPTGTTAGFGLIRAENPADLDRVWQRLRELTGRRTDRGSTLFVADRYLMEGYIDGPEYSVEAFSFAGRHVVVAITEKLVDERHFAELGHALPARLTPDAHTRLTEAVTGFLTVMGVTDGPSHTELRLGSRGPLVIESHNRLGGGQITEMIGAVHGIDLFRLSAGWALGTAEPLPDSPRTDSAACIRFLPGDPGTVTAVHGVDEVKARPEVLQVQVNVRPGDTVRPLRDNWDRLGFVVVRAEDTDTAVGLCEEFTRRTLRVEVETADRAPATPPKEPAGV